MSGFKLVSMAAGLAATVLAVTACSGNGNVTLHGTFTDTADTSSSGPACADQLSEANVAVTVDNVAAGDAAITWSGNPVVVGTYLSGQSAYGCTGTWSITVPSAHIGYEVSVTGLGGVSGSVTVPAADAGKQIVLNDATSNNEGGSVISEGSV